MSTRNIELDEEASEMLDNMAREYKGDVGRAVTELLRTHATIESFLDDVEAIHGADLAAQKALAEDGFRMGRFTPWEEVKRQNGL